MISNSKIFKLISPRGSKASTWGLWGSKIFGGFASKNNRQEFFLFSLLFFLLFLFSSVAVNATTVKNAGKTGLIGYWSFNEGVGTLAGDASGSGNTGTLTGTTWVQGKIGQALRFNGSSNYVSLQRAPITGGSSFTIVGWVNPAILQDKRFFADIDVNPSVETKGVAFGLNTTAANGINGNSLILQTGRFGWAWSVWSTPTNSLNQTNRWYHVAVTVTSADTAPNVTFYINGVSQSATPWSSGTGAVNYGTGMDPSARIGGVYTASSPAYETSYFNGSVDEVRVYNRALSPSEVSSLYLTGGGVIKSITAGKNGLAGYWPMNEGAGTQVGDNSGFKNTATFSGTPLWVNGKIGKALKFDGSTNYVRNDNFSIGTDPNFTISAWVKRTASINGKGVWGLGAGGVTGQTISTWNNVGEKIGIDLWSTATFYVNTDYPLNDWVHVTWVKNGANFSTNTIKIYVNGVEQSLLVSRGVAGTNYAETLTNGFTIGGIYPAGSAYDAPAVIDDVRVYNRVLSATEIFDLYKSSGQGVANASRNNVLTNGLVGLWSFDGKDMNWGTNKVLDRSGSGYDGTLIGMSTTSSPTFGKIGQSLKFTGNTDSVSIPTVISAYPFSVSLWATHDLSWNPAGSGTMDELVNMSIAGQRVSLGIADAWDVNGDITIMYGGTNHWSSGTRPSTLGQNDWHNLVWVVYGSNDSNHRVYIDGVLQTMTNRGGAHGGLAGWNIGNNSQGTEGWPGKIDDVRIYNRLLSDSEVKTLYNSGR